MAVIIPKIGLQLHTLRNEFANDPLATLREVAAIGFEGVEFVGSSLRSIDLGQLNLALSNNRLKVAGVAFEIEELDGELDSILQICRSIKCSTIVMPSIRRGDCQSRSGLVDVALKMNYIASRCKTEDIAFLYHTHGLELEIVEGRSGLEWLSGSWNPQLVRFEIDTCWVARAGIDAVSFVKQYGTQCSSIHFKDVNANKRDVEVGAGVIDMTGVTKEAMRHGVEWFIVEQEEFDGAPIESVKVSFVNLTGMRDEAFQAVAVS